MANVAREVIKKRLYDMMNDSKFSIQDCIGCIHDLYLEYIISDDEESELYNIVDPNAHYNDVSEYYYEFWDKFNSNPLRD